MDVLTWERGRTPRLKVGEVVIYQGRRCRVELVNESRAKIVPLDRRTVSMVVHDHDGEHEVGFQTSERGFNIAPNSELERVEPEDGR